MIPVEWERLDAGRWRGTKVDGDGTNGLTSSGVVGLASIGDLDGDAMLPSGTAWLRASVPDGAGSFPRSVTLAVNGATATRDLGDSAGSDLGSPLPPGTITSTDVVEAAGVIVVQPLASVGGRPPEDRGEYELRLAERLRHKDRASLGWDYERLALQRFPGLWQVGVVPAGRVPGVGPGHVRVVVVRDPAVSSDPIEPMVSPEELARIERELGELASAFADVSVVNPDYVRIAVTASVVFAAGLDPNAMAERLDRELVEFLSPGPAGSGDPAGDGSEAAVAGFIESRPYVTMLKTLELAHDPAVLPSCYYLTSARSHTIDAWTRELAGAGGSV